MKGKWKAFLILLFFLGFPAAGLITVWNLAHNRIRSSAIEYSVPALTEVFSQGTDEILSEYSTFQLRQSLTDLHFAKRAHETGKLLEVKNMTIKRSWAEDRNDMIFQFVEFHAVGRFEKLELPMHWILARRTMNPEWRFDLLEFGKR